MGLQAVPPLVIGIGNRQRGDDAAGAEVIHRLRRLGLPRVSVRTMDGEGTALLEAWDAATVVIVVDAVVSGGRPGTIHRFAAHDTALPTRQFAGSTHAVGLAEAVELGRALHRLPRRLIIYGIEGSAFFTGQALSPPVEAAVDRVVERIVRELER